MMTDSMTKDKQSFYLSRASEQELDGSISVITKHSSLPGYHNLDGNGLRNKMKISELGIQAMLW